MARRKVGRRARSRQVAGVVPGSGTTRGGAPGHPSGEPSRGVRDSESEAVSVTHWFDTDKDGESYTATVRFTGRRNVTSGKPASQDTFVKDETVAGIVPGSGPVAISTWVYDIAPGEWTVTADLVPLVRGAGAHRPTGGGRPRGAHSLPRAAWSWRRWALSSGSFAPVKTRWWPLARFARIPAVIPGSWFGLVALGVLVGAVVQTTLLEPANIAVGQALLVDLLALLVGLVGAQLWYVVLRRYPWRKVLAADKSVDGFLFAAPIVAAAALLAFDLPIGVFLDASAPGLFFGVAIGRLGCFFTGCCAGRRTRSRWGIWSSDRRVGARRIPTQLLESAAGLLIGSATLLLVLGSSSAPGAVFVAAVAAYVFVRQFLLRLRAEPHNRIRARLTAAAAVLVLVADAVVMLVSRN